MHMKRWKLFCAAGIFILLTAVKLLVPGLSDALRERTAAVLDYDGDYLAALETLGGKLSLAGSAHAEENGAALVLVPVRAEPAREKYYLIYTAEEGQNCGEETPEPVPAAVTAFLESQAAFADYELPEHVDYGYTALPFDYAVPVSGYNSSGFGYRLHPILNVVRFHYGTDFAANSGETIVAFADGTVNFAGYDESFGWHLKIDHGGGWVSHFCHCSRLCVGEGQSVGRGDAVALVGATGLATGPHLHFELMHGEDYVNPEYYVN